MISFKGKDKAYPYSLDIDADDEEEEEPHEVDVGGIKAQFFFDQPEEELIPSRFLEMAEDSGEPWSLQFLCNQKSHLELKVD